MIKYRRSDGVEVFLLLVLAFFIPLSNLSILDRSPIFYIFILTLILFIVRFRVFKTVFVPEIIVLSVIFFYKVLSIIWSINIEISFDSVFFNSLPLVLMTIILLKNIRSAITLTYLFKFYIYSCALISSILIFKFLNIDYNGPLNLDVVRVTFLHSNQNEIALMLCYALVFIVYLVKFNSVNVYKYGFLMMMIFIGVLLTGSRTGFMAINLIFIISVISVLTKRKIGVYLLITALCLSIYLFILTILPIELTGRSLSSLNINDSTSSLFKEGYRGWIWLKGLTIYRFGDVWNILFGIGYDTYGYAMQQNFGLGASHHNTFLGYLVELGILGLGLYLLLLLFLAYRVLILARSFSIIFVLFLIPILLFLFTQGLDNKIITYFIFIVIIKLSTFHTIKRLN
jgi:O-antigen ligase